MRTPDAAPWPHWPEYLAEATCLALFMISAATWATVLQHPASPAHGWLAAHTASALTQRLPMGIAMGLTAIGLIYSPVGQRSGAHMNPAVTATYFWLGKITPADAIGYILAQFLGGLLGLSVAVHALGGWPADPSVHFVATVPGPAGALPAFAGELTISFLLMTVVLVCSSHPRLARFTGVAAGLLVATLLTLALPMFLPPMLLGLAIIIGLDALGLSRGMWTIALGHIILTIPIVTMLVLVRLEGLDQNLELAAMDLGASPRVALVRISAPQAIPGIIAAGLISFALSMDEFILTSLVTGSDSTLPLYIFGQLRFSITPAVVAVSALLLLASGLLLVAGVLIASIGRRGSNRSAADFTGAIS